MAWLERVTVDRAGVDLRVWPWTLPAVGAMDTLVFEDGVTFLAAHGQSFLTRRSWQELDVVQQVRAFLESPERSFRHLLD